ncbi:MAG: hypothetical protein V3574_01190 [Candidatus Moraniibacteriota bacterium]
MDRKTKIFWLIVMALIFLSIGAAFYRYVIKKDYIIEAEVDCDPFFEPCFVWNCDPLSEEEGEMCTGEEEEDIWYYKIINKNAGRISACAEDDEDCEPLFCGENEPDCEFVFCNEENREEKGAQRCNDPMIYRAANPQEAEDDCEGEECMESDEEAEESMEQTTQDMILSEEEGLREEDESERGALPIAQEEPAKGEMIEEATEE